MTRLQAALCLVLLLAAGCYKPNGKKGVLYFGLEMPNGAGNGLAQDVSIPESVQFDVGGRTTLDFSNATVSGQGHGLVVEQSGAIDPAQQQQEQGGFWMRVLCDPSIADVTRELDVDIESGGQSRYRDSIDLTCLSSTTLSIAPIFPESWIIGTSVPASATLTAKEGTFASTQTLVGGHGWSDGDANPIVSISDDFDGSGTLLLTTVAAGSNPTIVAGTAQAPASMQVIADTAWALNLTVSRSSPYTAGSDAGIQSVDLTCLGESMGTDGSTVGGLGGESSDACDFTVTVDGSPFGSQSGEGCYATFQVPADAAGQVCATGARHTTCVSFGP